MPLAVLPVRPDLFDNWFPMQWTEPDNLRSGDLLVGNDPDGTPTLAAVIQLLPAFNPLFRPVLLTVDPHAAFDLDRRQLVAAFRWRWHGRTDMLGRDLTEMARLAGLERNG